MSKKQREFSIEKRQKAVSFLKEQTLSAYNNGDIYTVRHLSGVALAQVLKDGAVGLTLKDFLWAFVFMSFFRIDCEYSLLIEQAYEKFKVAEKSPVDVVESSDGKVKNDSLSSKKRHDNNQPSILLLNFVFDVLKEDLSNFDIHYQSLMEIDINKLPDYNSSYVKLLLTKVIEFWLFIDDGTGKWETLSEKWNHNKAVKDLYSRLKVQTHLLYNLDIEKTKSIIDAEFPAKDNPINNLLAKAWFYIFTDKWVKLDNLILEMKKIIPLENEYALSLLGIINSTRKSRKHVIETLHKTPLDNNEQLFGTQDDIFADDLKDILGTLRYQRIKMTRPETLFYLQLENYFDAKIMELKKEPHGKGYIRNNLLTIIMLLKLEALRFWDLVTYKKIIRRERELLFEIGMYYNQYNKYAGDPQALGRAIISAIKAGNEIEEYDTIKKSLYLLEALPDGKKHIGAITRFAVNTHQIQYLTTAKMFEILEDSIPAIYLEQIAHWSVKMFNHFSFNSYSFRINCFNFWDGILKYNNISSKMWTILEPAFKEMFNNPEYWHDSKNVLTTALRLAPLEKAMQWANCMTKIKIDDNFIEQAQYEILFNGAANTEELKRIADEYLNGRIADAEKNDLEKRDFWLYEKQLLNSLIGLQTKHEYIQHYLIDKLDKKRKLIHSESKGLFLSFKADYYDEFARVDWSACQSELLINAIDLIETTIYQSPNLTENDIGELLLPMSHIVKTAPIKVVERVVALVHRVIENPPPFHSNFFYDNNPFANFTLSDGTKNYININFAIIRIITEFYPSIKGTQKMFFLNWVTQESYTTETSNLGVFSRLLLYIWLSNDTLVAKRQSYKSLAVIYTRVQQGDGLAQVLYNLSITLQTKDTDKPLFKIEHYPKMRDLFNRLIRISYKYPNPEVREYCAYLVRAVIEAEGDIEHEIITTLKGDARARVRRFFHD